MPVYEYECENCGNKIEVFQKITDPPLENCELCNGRLIKLISNCSFQLKGTGWYLTDYKKKGSEKETKETKEEKKEDKKEIKEKK